MDDVVVGWIDKDMKDKSWAVKGVEGQKRADNS